MTRVEISAVLVLMAGLSGCSTSSDDTSAPISGSNKLKPVIDALEFENSYKATLINFYENQNSAMYYTDDILEVGVAEGSESSDSGSSDNTNSSAVTSTNLQEQGVDEDDRVKTDGQFLYVLEAPTYQHSYQTSDELVETSLPYNPAPNDTGNTVNVYRLSPGNYDLQAIREVDLNLAVNMSASGLFLYDEDEQKSLVVIGGGEGAIGWYDSYAWSAGSTSISLIDVRDPSEARVVNAINIDGHAISSRRIGNRLLIASRFHPDIEAIYRYPQTDEEKAGNRALISGLSLDDLLPKVTDQDGQSAQLTSAGDCFVPDVANQSAMSVDVISLYSVNLNDFSINSSLCYVGASEAFYASTDTVYLATTRYQWVMEQADVVSYQGSTVETDIHEFAFKNGELSYQASGSVEGHLGWDAQKRPFRLSARNGDLRVVTFTAELTANKSPVKLSVLRKNGSELELLSALPNAANPEPLGKPGESLYASRFVGDKVYFVTFRTTDPLYIIDLSMPDNPKRQGELFIDGYSDYLHPVGENLLLGIGKDAIAVQAEGDGRGAWYQGVKLSLIDVEDPANPLEVDKLVFGQRGSESTALFNHHAFTYLSAEETGAVGHLAFPLQINSDLTPDSASSAPWNWNDWQRTGLQLVNVDEENKTLSVQGFIETASPSKEQYAPNISNDRAVLLDDAVYFVQENNVYASGWRSQQVINGPR